MFAMTCYSPSRHYLSAACIAAAGLAVFAAWIALEWPLAAVFAIIFGASALILLGLAVQPSIEIYENHLAIGRKIIPWSEIRRLDRARCMFPLIVSLTLTSERRTLLIYPGGIDAGKSLLRHLRRCAKDARIDGIPYKQFWGELLSAGPERRQLPAPKYQLLRPDDEAEVERLFQRLKTVGHLDPKGDEK